MWGKLNQMVSGDQQKIESLEAQLLEEQERNKMINDQFKKVLKEKEKEIQKLKGSVHSDLDGECTSAVDDREEMKEEIMRLQRRIEEHEMLNTQKDENIQVLMQQANEADELRFKVEAQERVNSEKLMFELAGRIDAHEKLSNKLEEVQALLKERDLAVAELADEIAAKDQMLQGKEEAIGKLKSLTGHGTAANEERLQSLEIASAESERLIAQLRSTISFLELENETLNTAKDKKHFNEEGAEEVEALRKAFSSVAEEISGLEKKYEILNVLCSEFQSTVDYLQGTVKSNLEKLDYNGHEINQLYRSLSQMENDNSQLELVNNVLHAFIQDLRNHTFGLLANLNTSLLDLHEKSERSRDLCQILALAKNENMELKGKFDEMTKNGRNKIHRFQALLESCKQETEGIKDENRHIVSELSNVKFELDMSNSKNDRLTETLFERNCSNQALCTEIAQLKSDNDNLNKTICKLEATIIQLDGDMSVVQGDQAILLDAKKEMQEIDIILQSCRGQKDLSVEEAVASSPTASRLRQVLQVFEDERSELSQSLENAIQEKDEFYEKNEILLASIGEERDRFDRIVKKTMHLQEELGGKDKEKKRLSLQVVKETETLMDMLNLAEQHYETLVEKEQHMIGNINQLVSDRANKDVVSKLHLHMEEVYEKVESVNFITCNNLSNLKIQVDNMDSQWKQVFRGSEKDFSNLQAELICLQNEKSQYMHEKEGVVVEFRNLREQLKEECRVKTDLEYQVQEQKEEIRTLEVEIANIQENSTENERSLNAMLAEHKAQLDTANSILKTTEEAVSMRAQKSRDLEAEIDHLKRKYMEKEHELTVTSLSIDNQSVMVKQLQEQVNQLEDTYQTDMNGSKDKLSGLQKQSAKLQNNIVDLQKCLEIKDAELNDVLIERNEIVLAHDKEKEELEKSFQKRENSEIQRLNQVISDFELSIVQIKSDVGESRKKSSKKEEKLLGMVRKLQNSLTDKKGELVVAIKVKEETSGLLHKYTSEVRKLKRMITTREQELLDTQVESRLRMSFIDEKMKKINMDAEDRANLMSSLSMEIETLHRDKAMSVENSRCLNATLAEYMAQLDSIASTLKATEELVQRKEVEVNDLQAERDLLKLKCNEKDEELKLESFSLHQQSCHVKQLQEKIDHVQVSYKNDIGESKINFDNLQKQCAQLQHNVVELQKKIDTKDAELNELVGKRNKMILEHNEDIARSQAMFSDKEGLLYDKMEEMEKFLNGKLSVKDSEIERLNQVICDLEASILQIRSNTDITVRNLSKEEEKLSAEVRKLENSISEKGSELLIAIEAKEKTDNILDGTIRELAELKSTLLDKEQEAVALQEENRLHILSVNDFQEKCKELNATNGVLNTELNQKDEEIAYLNENLQLKTGEMGSLSIDLHDLEGRYNSLEALNAQLTLNVSAKDQQIKIIYQDVEDHVNLMKSLAGQMEITYQKNASQGNNKISGETVSDDMKQFDSIATTLKVTEDLLREKSQEAINLQIEKNESFMERLSAQTTEIERLNQVISIMEASILKVKCDSGIAVESAVATSRSKDDEWNNTIREKDRIIMETETQLISLTSKLEKLSCELGVLTEEKIGVSTTLVEKERELIKSCNHFKILLEGKEEELHGLKIVLTEREDEIAYLYSQIEITDEEQQAKKEKFGNLEGHWNNDLVANEELDESECYESEQTKKISSTSTLSIQSSIETTNELSKMSDTSPQEVSTAAAPELEWDPSEYMKEPGVVEEPIQGILETVQCAIVPLTSNSKYGVLPGDTIGLDLQAQDEKIKKLTTELELSMKSVNRYKRKCGILKKAQGELNKEILELQRLPNDKDIEIAKLKEENDILGSELSAAHRKWEETDERVTDIKRLFAICLNRDGEGIEIIDDTVDEILKKREVSNSEKVVYQNQLAELETVIIQQIWNVQSKHSHSLKKRESKQNELLLLQSNYNEIQTECALMREKLIDAGKDYQKLLDEKLERDGEFESIRQRSSHIEGRIKSHVEILLKSLLGLFFGLKNGDTQMSFELFNIDIIQEDQEFLKNIQYLTDEVNTEMKAFLNLTNSDQNLCQEAKVKALNEIEVFLLKWSITEVGLLTNNKVTEERDVTSGQDKVDQILNDVTDVLPAYTNDIQRNKIGALLHVKEKLQMSATMSEKVEALQECSEVFKQLMMQENEALNAVLVEKEKQHSNLLSQLNELKSHKDLVIKKLKLKLKKEISEKGRLNDSLTEPGAMSSILIEKETLIQNLHSELSQKSFEYDQSVTQCTNQIAEKDDLNKALKDELTWLKESITPLMEKSDNAENFQKENQSLKYCIESINAELIHLKENALLKENEMMYLIDQEKRIQDEYLALQDTLRSKEEEREIVVKSMKDEMNWLQTQVDDLSPKAEELTNAVSEIEFLKETITKETSFQRELQKQLSILETKAVEKENIYTDLQGHCNVLEARLEDMMSKKEKMDELNSSFKEMEELCSSKGEELSQVNECLATREVQLEDIRKELMEQKNTCEELQGLLQDRDVENRQIRSLVDEGRSVVQEKESLVTELLNEVNKEQGKVATLNEKLKELNDIVEKSRSDGAVIQRKNSEIEHVKAELKFTKEHHVHLKSRINDLMQENGSLKQFEMKHNEIREEVAHLIQRNISLKEIEGLYYTQRKFLKEYQQKLIDKEEIIRSNVTSLGDKGHQLSVQQKHMDGLEHDLMQLFGKVSKPAWLKTEDIEKSKISETLIQIIEENNASQAAKEEEYSKVLAENASLVQQMITMQDKYEASICILNASIAERDGLYNNSLQQVNVVKKMLEAETLEPSNNLRGEESTPGIVSTTDHEGDASACDALTEHLGEFDKSMGPPESTGWDDAINVEEWDDDIAWGDKSWNFVSVEVEKTTAFSDTRRAEDVTSTERTTLKEVGNPVVDITLLKNEVLDLNQRCKTKENELCELRDKLESVVSEREDWKREYNQSEEKLTLVEGIGLSIEEICGLKESVDNLLEEKNLKEVTIAKLKLKLKQTIKGRDQLKENLQSELDRISKEKDLIFNEFSEKISQQNAELVNLRSNSIVLAENVREIDMQLNEKNAEIKDVKDSLIQWSEKQEMDSEFKLKYDELENEKNLLNESMIRERKLKDETIDQLREEVCKMKSDIDNFTDLSVTLEEAVKVKDDSIDNMRRQMETLHQEKVKLSNDYQAHSSKNQEQEELIVSLGRQVQRGQEEVENLSIMVSKYEAEIGALEILFGVAGEEGPLAENISVWKLETDNKMKTLERQLKCEEMKMDDVSHQLDLIETACEVVKGENQAIPQRLLNIYNHFYTCKHDLKCCKVELDSLKEHELFKCAAVDLQRESQSTYQLLEDKIGTFSTLAQVIQEKVAALCENRNLDSGIVIDGEENLRILPSIINEMSTINHQLEKDLSYSKTEWIHMQAENVNLKQQLDLLTNSLSTLEDRPIPDDGGNTNVLLEMQASFQVALADKDQVISSLRKRIGDLRDELLSKTCQLSQYAMQRPKSQSAFESTVSSDRIVTEKARDDEKSTTGDLNELNDVKDTEDMFILLSKYKAEIEGLEVLFGVSNEGGTLAEHVSQWKLETSRQLKLSDMKMDDVSRQLDRIETSCQVLQGKDQSIAQRLLNIFNQFYTCKHELKCCKLELGHLKEPLKDPNVDQSKKVGSTFQHVEDKIERIVVLLQQLQEKVDPLCEYSTSEDAGNVILDIEENLQSLPTIIQEISTLKHQLEKDISYTKREWSHLQARNEELKPQLHAFDTSSATRKEASILHAAKAGALMEMEDSFQDAVKQKDDIRSSQPKKNGDELLHTLGTSEQTLQGQETQPGLDSNRCTHAILEKKLVVDGESVSPVDTDFDRSSQLDEVAELNQRLVSMSKCLDEKVQELRLKETSIADEKSRLRKNEEHLQTALEKLKEKNSECIDLSEENIELKEEIIDLKESLQETEKGGEEFYRSHLVKEMETLTKLKEGYERDLKTSLESINIVKLSHESNLREKDHLITQKEEEVTKLNDELQDLRLHLQQVHSNLSNTSLEKENLATKCISLEDDAVRVTLENTNLKKQIEVLTLNITKLTKPSSQMDNDDQSNGAFLELRGSFEEVVAHKDSVIDSMKKDISEYRDELLILPDKYQHQLKLHESQVADKERKISELNRTVVDVTAKNAWLKEELDRVISEKKNNFENISSGLRTDLEIAFKEKKEHGDSLQIYCLKLERDLKQLEGELFSNSSMLTTKDHIISEQKSVIKGLQTQIEDSTGRVGYKVFQEQLSKRLEELNQLSSENRDLCEKLSNANDMYNNVGIELCLAQSEKNQLKLEASSQINDIMLMNKEEIQNLTATFENSIQERDDELSVLRRNISMKENAYQLLLSKFHSIETKQGYNTVPNQETTFKCDELKKTLDEKNETIELLKNQITAMEEKQVEMEKARNSEIKQIIQSKGKHLKDIRLEFEMVFGEKNRIIETIRNSLKCSREEVVSLQQRLCESEEGKRSLEKHITDIELEKLQMEEEKSKLREEKLDLGDCKVEDLVRDDICNELKSENDRLMQKMVFYEQSQGSLSEERKERSVELENEHVVLRKALADIAVAIKDVSDLSHINDSIENLPKKIQQLANNMISSKKYCDELSMKLHLVMEEKRVCDFSAQFDAVNGGAEVHALEEEVKQLNEKLARVANDMENAQLVIREEYDDILSNLQSDLAASMGRHKSLEEENFSLRNQLDVFTNVNKKKQLQVECPSSLNSSKPLLGTQHLSRDTDKVEQKEGLISKSEFSKLKALCRKYKNELITTKSELDLKDKQSAALSDQLQASNETINEEKVRYMQENRDLRDEINVLVEEKDEMIESFKNRNETELVEMKEMYQKSLNQLSSDIRLKDDIIEQYQCELDILKTNSNNLFFSEPDSTLDSELSALDGVELVKRAKVMKQQITTLQADKLNCLSQLRSHREEITEFVHQRDQMVIMWQSKLEQKEKREEAYRKEIDELVKRIEGSNRENESSSVVSHPPEQTDGILQLSKQVDELKYHKQVAESRLLDVVLVLQDFGIIEKVQAKLLEQNSSLKHLSVTAPTEDVEQLKKSLGEKDSLISEYEERITHLEEKLRLWHVPYQEGSVVGSRISEIIDWPDSDQGSIVSDFGSLSSRPSVAPSTPTMDRN